MSGTDVCRRVKSPAELSLLHSSAQIAAQGITAAMANTAAGISEHQIAAEFGAFAAMIPALIMVFHVCDSLYMSFHGCAE